MVAPTRAKNVTADRSAPSLRNSLLSGWDFFEPPSWSLLLAVVQ